MAWPTDRFPSAQEIYDRLKELANRDPLKPILKVFDFETVGGKGGPTQGNEGPRTSNWVRIGPQAPGPGRVCVVFIGGVHAREWSPPTLLVNLIEKLAEAYVAGSSITVGGATFTAAQVKDIVEKVDLLIAPLINPDGYEWTRNVVSGERMWRKNRRPPPASVPAHCGTCGAANPDRFGVDINRNCDVIWQFNSPTGGDGTFSVAGVMGNMSCNPCDHDVYVGESAASERETQNVAFLLDKNPQYFVDCHMTGRKIYHSWGTDDNNPIPGLTPALTSTPRDGFGGVTKDDINEDFLVEIRDVIGNRMADATGLGGGGTKYAVVLSSSLGAFSGATDDFAMSKNLPSVPGGKQPIRAYTIECGVTFLDRFTGEFPKTQKEMHAALLSLLTYAVSPAGLRAVDPIPAPPTPTPTPQPKPAKGCNCQIAPVNPPEDDI